MKLSFKIFGPLICVVLVSHGCAGLTAWTKLEQRVYQEKANHFRAEFPKDWMRSNWAQYFFITKDGSMLNRIEVERKKIGEELEHTKKSYYDDMSVQEMAELEIDNLKADKNVDRLVVSVNRPIKISGYSAFRIEFSFQTLEGLKVKTIQCGFFAKERIYRIRYQATAQHYYDATHKDFERFLETFEILE